MYMWLLASTSAAAWVFPRPLLLKLWSMMYVCTAARLCWGSLQGSSLTRLCMSAAPFPRSFTPAEAQSSISSFWVCRSLSYCLRLLACHLRVLATRSRLGACFCVRTHGKSAHDDNAHGSRTNFTTPVFQSGCSPSKTQTASIVACTPFGGCFTLRSGSCDVGEAGENAHRGVM